MAKIFIGRARERMYEQVCNTMALGRDEEAYDLMTSGVKSRPHILSVRFLEFYHWCLNVKQWPEPVPSDYMNKLSTIAQAKNSASRQ